MLQRSPSCCGQEWHKFRNDGAGWFWRMFMPPNSDCRTVNQTATGCCSQALNPGFFSLKALEKLRKMAAVWEHWYVGVSGGWAGHALIRWVLCWSCFINWLKEKKNVFVTWDGAAGSLKFIWNAVSLENIRYFKASQKTVTSACRFTLYVLIATCCFIRSGIYVSKTKESLLPTSSRRNVRHQHGFFLWLPRPLGGWGVLVWILSKKTRTKTSRTQRRGVKIGYWA